MPMPCVPSYSLGGHAVRRASRPRWGAAARRTATACLLLVGAPALSHAHTAWLEPDPAAAGTYVVRFGGHEGKTESYPPEKLKSVQARDARGRPLAVDIAARADGVRVSAGGPVALYALHFDNGIFSRADGGRSVPRPMNENPGATQGTHAVKYGKHIVAWSAAVTRPVGQPFEVVPLEATPPRPGQPWQVRVLIDGQPAADVPVSHDEASPDASRTGADGVATFLPRPGPNKLWAGRRTPVSGDPRFTQLSIEYLLTFEAR
jgi:nickel transport protein